MIDLKEQAKKIIAKGKELADPELIQMGLDLLNEESPEEKPVATKPKRKKASPNKTPAVNEVEIDSQFRIINRKNKIFGKTSIDTKQKRQNKFFDDGTEFANLKGKTPPALPKEKRIVKKASVTCRACGKKETVLESLVMPESSGYRCDNCILKGRY